MDTPWILLGDFKSPLSVEDKEGGTPITTYQISDFQDCVMRNGLEDLSQVGCKYTWSNNEVFCKLDHCMVNKKWLEEDMRGMAEFLAPGYISDHTPCVVTIMEAMEQTKKPFKFFNMWITHEDYNSVVEEQWTHLGLDTRRGMAQYKFKLKLQRLKTTFKQFNRLHFQHIKERSLRVQEEFQRMQEIGYAIGTFEEGYQLVQKRADQLNRADFLYCKQKAKCKYFREVDRNTTYFHALVEKTNRMREIMVIEKRDGGTTTCLNEIVNEFVESFQGLLGTSLQRIPLNTDCLNFGRTLNLEQQGSLILMPMEEEIKKALFSIGDQKVLGPDGYGSKFFKHS
ncbi:uncharacterized protein LOC122026839 [Zingiber officinale]|uniref:uncharacterized protein LOC122026839 n=1 Tax=Zingiber officinale TaxID=94328 RepID=UPI001C4DB526|nr:uncharacterized protein LOC122026839 [Zingiber officinale]